MMILMVILSAWHSSRLQLQSVDHLPIALQPTCATLPRLMNLKPASRIAIRAFVTTVRAIWYA